MTRVFLSTWGQNDNLGDSVLRRGLLRAFRDADDVEVHVFVGDNDDGYLSALDLSGHEVLYRSRRSWWREGISHLVRERTILVQTAGELIPQRSPLAGWRTVLGATAARLKGGGGVQIGAGLRDPHRDVPFAERLARRTLKLVAWRDRPTRDAFAVGDVVPDWAFAEGEDPFDEGLGPGPSERSLLVVTFRGDRAPLRDEQFDFLRDLASSRGLETQVVTQVRRDNARAIEVAARLGSTREPQTWGDHTHSEWETVVRSTYRRAAIIASDRAHALIIGATEGAVPLGISGGTTEKIVRILAPAGFQIPADALASGEQYLATLTSEPGGVSDRVAEARAQIEEVRSRIKRTMLGAHALRPTPGA